MVSVGVGEDEVVAMEGGGEKEEHSVGTIGESWCRGRCGAEVGDAHGRCGGVLFRHSVSWRVVFTNVNKRQTVKR